ncbi:MAG TPA: tRNA (cytidine(34)-2'-O)-methyltransferase [Pirellulaceae bacterium]|nr:tRNA (cytidine(34)-2'-O)-methyltransferase [Pirellulaceae bacterium]HMO91595.1 tRNA (cytidine(34)-2'-O)-methyltransferase [Pirellulaceae bacterium]HMP68292.1 tRNA (cytidine(34)-2'-O)-methyltransferase [Pirellulaceae bacterium]
MANYEPRFHVVLHQPEIPGNTGAIGRTCVALEAKLWLVRPLGFQVDEKTLRRAGLDYWQYLEWEVVDNWQMLLDKVAGRVWTFSKTATQSFDEADFCTGDWLVFGSETRGLPSSILQNPDFRCLRIPTSSLVRSLNLSCAVAVAGYQVHRSITLTR